MASFNPASSLQSGLSQLPWYKAIQGAMGGAPTTDTSGGAPFTPPPNANNTFDPAAPGQSPTQQSWSTVGSGYPGGAAAPDLGYRPPGAGPPPPTAPGGMSRPWRGPVVPGATPQPLPGSSPAPYDAMWRAAGSPGATSSTSSALTSGSGAPAPTPPSATPPAGGAWRGGNPTSSTSSSLTYATPSAGGGTAPPARGALPNPTTPSAGALGPVYGGLDALGLDPGAANRNLSAGLMDVSRAAQQSAYDQRQYTANALSQTEGAFNPAIAAYQGAYGEGGSLAGPGALEQFAASDMAGSNPYYQMLSREGHATIDQGMNAGGNYGSGARLAANAKYQGNLDAQQYQQEAQLQGQAQAAKEGRINTGFSSGLGLGAGQAGIAASMYGKGSDAYANMISSALAGNADAMKAMAQSGADQQGGIMSLLRAF